MNDPITYTDPDGAALTVEPWTEGSGAVAVRTEGFVVVPPDDRAAVAALLWTAAGLPAPVILDRPAATFAGGVNRAGCFETGCLNGRVTVGLYGIQPEEIEPGEARRLAALIAVRADEAEDGEPDPAEVDELTRILRRITPGMAHPGGGDYKTAVVRPFAEAALRWMRDKQQRGEP